MDPIATGGSDYRTGQATNVGMYAMRQKTFWKTLSHPSHIYWSYLDKRPGFPGAPVVKNLPPMQEIQVQSLGQEDPLEKEMATHSSVFAWGVPGTEELVGYSPWGLKESDMTEQLNNDSKMKDCIGMSEWL